MILHVDESGTMFDVWLSFWFSSDGKPLRRQFKNPEGLARFLESDEGQGYYPSGGLLRELRGSPGDYPECQGHIFR
jgi:hypothetical protein